MKDGVIADFTYTEKMLQYFINKVHGNRFFTPSPRVARVRAIGSTKSNAEPSKNPPRVPVRALSTSCLSPWRAVGAGLPVHEARGSMVLDIGGGTSEVAIVSLERHCLRG